MLLMCIRYNIIHKDKMIADIDFIYRNFVLVEVFRIYDFLYSKLLLLLYFYIVK